MIMTIHVQVIQMLYIETSGIPMKQNVGNEDSSDTLWLLGEDFF